LSHTYFYSQSYKKLITVAGGDECVRRSADGGKTNSITTGCNCAEIGFSGGNCGNINAGDDKIGIAGGIGGDEKRGQHASAKLKRQTDIVTIFNVSMAELVTLKFRLASTAFPYRHEKSLIYCSGAMMWPRL
jgi:hypothetical protein